AIMIPWLHFGNTDYLIFKAWRPSSYDAIAGACIGLFLFCILERCLAAYRRTQELRWSAKTILMSSRVQSSSSKKDSTEASRDGPIPTRRQLVPPFTPSRDIPRGLIQAIQSIFSYALMLTVMTFNGAYIISVVLGLGIGEVLFGRMGRK
ncbi:Ctr copper transporter, partial [Boletus coccyginus]